MTWRALLSTLSSGTRMGGSSSGSCPDCPARPRYLLTSWPGPQYWPRVSGLPRDGRHHLGPPVGRAPPLPVQPQQGGRGQVQVRGQHRGPPLPDRREDGGGVSHRPASRSGHSGHQSLLLPAGEHLSQLLHYPLSPRAGDLLVHQRGQRRPQQRHSLQPSPRQHNPWAHRLRHNLECRQFEKILQGIVCSVLLG